MENAETDRFERSSGWRGSRELWLQTAREAFLENGIEAVKIQPLAARIGLSRTSFYWFFHDRQAILSALLEDWQRQNTGALLAACEAYAATIAEAVLNVIGAFLDTGGPGAGFDARFDFAMRGWALRDDEVMARVKAEDETRLAAIRGMFERFGFDAAEADVRARTVYLVQIGYISMQSDETLATRMARIPAYVKTYTGQAASEGELARFHAAHGYSNRTDSEAS